MTKFGGMRKVNFNNSRSIELSRSLGANLTADQSKVLRLEGWLVDDHICVQKPLPKIGADWRVCLYPWGHVVSGDFYTKDDAIEYARDLSALGIDWQKLYDEAKNFGETPGYKRELARLIELHHPYAAEGFFKIPE